MGAPGGGLMDIVGTPFEAIGLDPTGIPIIGGMFGNSPAEAAQLAQMRAASQAYKDMRDPQAQARSASLLNTLEGIGGGGNALMEQMSGGPGYGMDFQQAATNPITPEMLEVGSAPVQDPEDEGGGGGGGGLDPIGAIAGGIGALGNLF